MRAGFSGWDGIDGCSFRGGRIVPLENSGERDQPGRCSVGQGVLVFLSFVEPNQGASSRRRGRISAVGRPGNSWAKLAEREKVVGLAGPTARMVQEGCSPEREHTSKSR